MAWTPATLRGSSVGMVGWYDALDAKGIALNGANVASWSDKSGNGNNMAQATAGNQPPYANESLPYIGVNNIAGTVGLTSTKSFSVKQAFTMLQYKTGVESGFGGQETMYSGPGGLGVNRFIMGTGSGSPQLSGGGTVDLGFAQKNGAASSAVVLPMPWSVLVSTLDAVYSQVWNIGCNMPTAGRTWTGYYREIILLSTQAETPLQRKIEGYLAWKWGTQELLTSDHPYRYHRPMR